MPTRFQGLRVLKESRGGPGALEGNLREFLAQRMKKHNYREFKWTPHWPASKSAAAPAVGRSVASSLKL